MIKSKNEGVEINYLSSLVDKIKIENNVGDLSHIQKYKDEKTILDVMSFCNREDMLDLPGNNLRLFLSQRVILKTFYMGSLGNEDVELSDEEWKWLHEKQQNSALCKIKRKTDGINDGDPHNFNFRELNLACGRRASKTLIASIICAYEAYKLIQLDDPYLYYNIPYDEEMAIINVSNSQKQSGRLFSQIKARIRNAPFFNGRIQGKGESNSELRVYTNQDLKKIKDKNVNISVEGSIVLICGHSNPETLRGYSSPCILFDELQYYTEHPVVSGADFYNALTPSITKFAMKGDGRLVEISTTGSPTGIFYNIHRQGQSLEDSFNQILGYHLATWDINDDLPYDCDFLSLERAKDSDSFDIEYGARWSNTGVTTRYFPEEKVRRSFKTSIYPQDRGEHGGEYFMHIDPAAKRNNYAIVIVQKKRYVNHRGQKRHKVILAKHYYWTPIGGLGLNLVELDDKALDIARTFRPRTITYDTWNSVHSVDYLKKHGFHAKQINFGKYSKQYYYQNLLDLMDRDELELYYDDIIMGELLNLKFKATARGIKISPDYRADIDTDDLSDGLAGAAWMAVGVQMQNSYPAPITFNIGRI